MYFEWSLPDLQVRYIQCLAVLTKASTTAHNYLDSAKRSHFNIRYEKRIEFRKSLDSVQRRAFGC